MAVVSRLVRLFKETIGAASESRPHRRKHGVCPKCGGHDVRRSSNKRVADDFMRLFSLKPFRCRSCRRRFFLKGSRNAHRHVTEEEAK
jgi:transposase-like protein